MKVRELIEYLEKVPMDATVWTEQGADASVAHGIIFDERWNDVMLSNRPGLELIDDDDES